jgi:DNA invertase Pin-like site-specific DNA recombinase
VQQTTENRRRALDEIAERAGWQVVEIYADEISGTKGRKRPSPSQARSQCRQRGSKIPYLALK